MKLSGDAGQQGRDHSAVHGSGVRVAELTNASTTSLLDVHRRRWDTDLIESLSIPASLFAPLRAPGDVIGPLRHDVRQATGFSSETVLTLVGSHDTASAVVGVPAGDVPFAYIACGTWSLVGVELDHPVLTEESRAANFTNAGRSGVSRSACATSATMASNLAAAGASILSQVSLGL